MAGPLSSYFSLKLIGITRHILIVFPLNHFWGCGRLCASVAWPDQDTARGTDMVLQGPAVTWGGFLNPVGPGRLICKPGRPHAFLGVL